MGKEEQRYLVRGFESLVPICFVSIVVVTLGGYRHVLLSRNLEPGNGEDERIAYRHGQILLNHNPGGR